MTPKGPEELAKFIKSILTLHSVKEGFDLAYLSWECEIVDEGTSIIPRKSPIIIHYCLGKNGRTKSEFQKQMQKEPNSIKVTGTIRSGAVQYLKVSYPAISSVPDSVLGILENKIFDTNKE